MPAIEIRLSLRLYILYTTPPTSGDHIHVKRSVLKKFQEKFFSHNNVTMDLRGKLSSASFYLLGLVEVFASIIISFINDSTACCKVCKYPL